MVGLMLWFTIGSAGVLACLVGGVGVFIRV